MTSYNQCIKEAQAFEDEMPALNRKVGRPRQYETAAERQRAYRLRLKERGMRVVQVVIRDVRKEDAPLKSDVILLPPF